MKKGFTLVELLAVIVILAILAVIAIVVISNVIDSAKIGKYRVEEKSLVKAAELYYVTEKINRLDELDINVLIQNNYLKQVHDTGNGGYCEGKVINTEDGLKGCLQCSNYQTSGCGYVEPEVPVPVPGIDIPVTDTYPGIICGNTDTEDYDNVKECHIKSVEDLAKFTYMVNVDKKTFEGKTVYLDNDLDINNNNSYANQNYSIAGFDMNGDGTVSNIKTEMTSAKGFMPIGNSTTNFKGDFDGGAYTIYNLMINRPAEDNIGMFGYFNGYKVGTTQYYSVVKGLNLKNASIIGKNNVGAIIGYMYDYSRIRDVIVSGNVEAKGNYAGGAAGYINKSNCYVKNIISNTNVKGLTYIGGLVGYGNTSTTVNGVVESVTLEGTNYVYPIGKAGTSSYFNNSLVNNNIDIVSDGANKGSGGTTYNDSNYGNLIMYNTYIDTYLNGDEDNTGYYFDYENEKSNKIILYSTKKNPIPALSEHFEQEGTSSDPYQIKTTDDMKIISAHPTEVKYYKLMNDLDYNNKHYYIIGTNNTYSFKGIFRGDARTIKNVSIEGLSSVGLFGYVYGSSSSSYSYIQGLNIENINIKGTSNLGALAGTANGYTYISDIAVSGNIEGTGNNVGGVVGERLKYETNIRGVLVRANVKGQEGVGGIVGFSNTGMPEYVRGVIESGTIEGTDYVYAGGKSNTGTKHMIFILSNSEKVNIVSTGTYKGHDSVTYTNDDDNNLQYYSASRIYSSGSGALSVLESPYTGDTNGNGYYFDYNATGDKIIVVKVGSTLSSITPTRPYTYINEEAEDKIAPTCTIARFSVNGNGFSASYNCTDDVAVKSKKHIYWNAQPTSVNFNDLIAWPSTANATSSSINSVWTIESAASQGIDPPVKGECYYFYFGAEDTSGNKSIYVTPNCLSF